MNTNMTKNDRRPRGTSAPVGAYFNSSFFHGVMRRAWPKLLCYSLVLFFILPLPILFSINERRAKTASVLVEMLDRMLTRNLWLYCIAAAALGVFAGILATHYLTRRASVDYYHSLPLRREGLLITHWLEGALHFASGLGINLLITLAVIATVAEVGGGFGLVIGKLTLDVAYMLMVFLLFYTLTVFCGILCGTSVMQVMVTGLTLGAYPLFRLLLIAFGEEFVSRIDIYAMTERGWRYLSPLLRLFFLSGTDTVYGDVRNSYLWEEPFLWWEILLWIAATVGLFLASLLLYRRRHVERAGTPVVFGGVAAAVRWVVVLIGTMALGWLFQALGNGGLFWLFFGFLLGGFLAFILVGTLLTKNPKQMFEGWRRLIIYLVLFCLLFVGFGWACSAVDGWIPKHIDRVSLYFDNENYCVPYYRDADVIAAWQDLERDKDDGNWTESAEVYTEEYYDEPITDAPRFYFNGEHIALKAYVKAGPIVIPYRTQSYRRAEMAELYRAVTASAEFEAGWSRLMAEIAQHGLLEHDPLQTTHIEWGVTFPDSKGRLSMYRFLADAYGAKVDREADRMMTSEYDKNEVLAPVGEGTAEAVFADFDRVDFEFFQSPVYGVATIPNLARDEDRRMGDGTPRESIFRLYLHMSAPSLYREAMEMEENAFYEAMADSILATEYGGLYVAKGVKYSVSLDDEHVMKITDRAQIIEVLRGMSVLDYNANYYTCPHFTVFDENYGVIFPNGGGDSVIYFIDGKVPAFVKSTLG